MPADDVVGFLYSKRHGDAVAGNDRRAQLLESRRSPRLTPDPSAHPRMRRDLGRYCGRLEKCRIILRQAFSA
jgi:hypothetical protein